MKTTSKVTQLCISGSWLALAAPAALAQTSGTLATQTSVDYSAAGWVITSGPGTYPTGGGTAEFDAVTGLTTTVPGTTTITLDVTPTLSGIIFDSPFNYTLAATGSNSLALSSSGATITATNTPASTPTLFSFGDVISAPITGGGGTGLTITGGGIVDLIGANTYMGGTTITGGSTLVLSTASDAALGATGTGNGVTMNNGSLLVYSGAATPPTLTTARNFTLGAGGGNFELFTGLTIGGIISGSGALGYTDLSAGTLALTGANTYTGATTTNGTLILSGANGAIASSTSYTFGGELSLDSSGSNNSNRLSDTATLTLNGTYFLLTGNSAAATAEKVGATTLNGGNTFLVVTPNSATSTSLTFASLTRSNNSTLALTGTGLGDTPGAGVATILSTTAPTLIGGGGAAGSKTISIVPWATGNTTANSVGGTSFVTYGSNGFRPLQTSEYTTGLTNGSTGTTRNVRLTVNAAVPSGGATVNSVLMTDGVTLASTSSSVLAITSGALMYSPSSSQTNGTVSANLNFGTAEGVLTSTNYYDNTAGDGFLTVSGNIAGSGGLTINPINGGYITLSGANTYTGTTTLLAGTTEFSGTVANDGTTAGAFGTDTSAIVFDPGATGLSFFATSASIINRNLTMTGSGSVDFGTTGNFILSVTGNINLQNSSSTLILDGGDTLASTMRLSGRISGSGSITDNAAYTPYTYLGGSNTYTGGTNIQQGTYIAGSDTAFGTGTISTNYVATTSGSTTTYTAGTIQGYSTTPRTIANPTFFGNGTLAAFTFGGSAPLNLSGSIDLNGATAINFANTGGTTFSGVVSDGALVKSGAGTLTLSNANTYTGGTIISAGSVLATNASGSATGPGAVFVNASGTLLGGTGAVAGPVTVVSGGIVEGGVGAATGALTLNNNLTLASGSIIELALATSGPTGTNSSLARGGGTWTFAAAQKFTFLGSAAAGVTYDNLITGLAADPGSESAWTITNTGFAGTFTYDGAGDIDLTITGVPEPATWLVGALTVLLGAAAWRQRQRGQKPALPTSV